MLHAALQKLEVLPCDLFVPLQCLHKAIAICKPGTPYRDIGDVISKHAKAHGWVGG